MSKKSRSITDFFTPFTIPKNHIPRQDEDDEIVVASSSSSRANTRERSHEPVKGQALQSPRKQQQQRNGTSPVKRGRGRPRKDDPSSPSKLRIETKLLDEEHSGHSTPTRKSPRKGRLDMQDFQDVPPASSGLTSVQSSLKESPNKMRSLEAVEIPSSAEPSSPLMPAPTRVPAAETKTAVNTSFCSTLTSFSGMSSQSSSRRIVKNGIPAVTNSDSASMSSSSSDDELADLDSFAPRKKRRLTPPAPEKVEVPKPTRSSTRLGEEKVKKKARESWRPLSPPPTTKYKYSLLSISKTSAEEAESEQRIAQAEAYMQAAQKLQQEQDSRTQDASTSKTIAASFAQDSEEGERVLMAMDRTDALRGEETFYFFHGEDNDRMEVEFPKEELDACGLSFLRDDSSRIRACSSGFLAVVASQKGLPRPLVSWMHNQIFEEGAEDLCESYVAVVDALVKSEHDLPDLAFSLSETHAGQTFRDAEEPGKSSSATAFPGNLDITLRMMASIAPRATPIDLACALAELILLNNDENVRSNIKLQTLIERTMRIILKSSTTEDEYQTVSRETTRQILHASSISRHLLCRAIATLPATSLRQQQIRRKLALHILLDAPPDEEIDPTSPSTGVRLLLKIKKHPSFHISESTDYTTLHSLADLLDIAIDAGFSDFTFLSTQEEEEAKPQPQSHQTHTLFSHATTPQSAAELSFNAQIDSLVAQLRLTCSKIRDAGTSHLKRTEAKSTLERLVVRLECAVRTKPKPRKGAFELGGGGGNARLSAGVLEKYLKRQSGGSTKETGSSDGDGSKTVRDVKGAQQGKERHRVTWGDDVVGHGDENGDADVEAGASSSADEDDGLLDDVDDGVDDASSVVHVD
jgi:hypothetical protein